MRGLHRPLLASQLFVQNLVSTNRDTSGRAYQRMGDALARLSGTRIETNIETKGKRERRGFGLIDSWSVIERDLDNRMIAVEVTLPEWLYRSVESKHVLTLSRDYFRLRKPLNRRIYELARKHCGAQSKWSVSLPTLHLKRSYCQIWCMTIKQRSCQIGLPPLYHPETERCSRPVSVGQTP